MTGLLLAAAGGLSPLWAAVPCRTSQGQSVSLPAEACPGGTLLAERIFDRLLPVLGYTQETLRFTVDLQDDSIFSFHLARVRVSVSRGLLERFGANEAVLLFALSHELGHAAQHQAPGWLEARRAFTEAQVEAHADMMGGRIADRAGFPVELFLAGQAAFFERLARETALRPWTWRDGRGGYPANSQRRLNMETHQRTVNRLAAGPGPGDFTREGLLRPDALAGRP